MANPWSLAHYSTVVYAESVDSRMVRPSMTDKEAFT